MITPIHTRQQWNTSVMAAIWKKRDSLDPGQLAAIKALYDNAKQHNRHNTSFYSYHYSKHSVISKAGYGRLYAIEKGSLERIEKTLRHSLCAGIYWDIDMVNAQPTILSQMATRRGLPLTLLSYYISHREQMITRLMDAHHLSRCEIKEWFIKCMFGAAVPELKELQTELRLLANELRNEYNELYEYVILLKEKNVIGTFLAYVAQTEECRCLVAMNDFFTSYGREVGVLCYDGCLIYIQSGESCFPPELLLKCSEYIFTVTGYTLQLLVKPMECSPDFYQPSAKLLRTSDIDDVFMTRKFITSMRDKLIHDKHNGIMVYQEDIGFWSNDPDILRRAIVDASLVEETMDGTVNYSGFLYKQDIIIKQLPSLIPVVDFCEKSIDKTIGKLLFSNGIYNMITRTFTSGFDPSLYFSGRITRCFPTERNHEYCAIVNKILFQDPFLDGECGVYLKQLVARAIAGHYEDKVTIWAVGETNSGKGAQSTALYNCFDSFVTSYNPNALLYNKNSGSDEAKKLSWVYPIHNSRISIGNEVRPGGIIDTSILKSLVSGGDAIPIRKNFKDEENKINRATLLYFCNDIATFNASDNATISRIKLYEYKISFVDKPGETLEPWERPSIPNLKHLFQSDEYKNAYFWCIMDAYQPTIPVPPRSVLESAYEWIPAPSASFSSCLRQEGYEIVLGDGDAFVPFSDIKRDLVRNGVAIGMTDTAIGRELSKLGLDLVIKKIQKKSIKCRRFIKLND
jgi:hypothetical protein